MSENILGINYTLNNSILIIIRREKKLKYFASKLRVDSWNYEFTLARVGGNIKLVVGIYPWDKLNVANNNILIIIKQSKKLKYFASQLRVGSWNYEFTMARVGGNIRLVVGIYPWDKLNVE